MTTLVSCKALKWQFKEERGISAKYFGSIYEANISFQSGQENCKLEVTPFPKHQPIIETTPAFIINILTGVSWFFCKHSKALFLELDASRK